MFDTCCIVYLYNIIVYISIIYVVCILTDEDSVQFKGAAKKFYKRFSMPTEEKLVNCKCISMASNGICVHLFNNIIYLFIFARHQANCC